MRVEESESKMEIVVVFMLMNIFVVPLKWCYDNLPVWEMPIVDTVLFQPTGIPFYIYGQFVGFVELQ